MTLAVALPPADGRPLYRRLLGALRDDIDSGRLQPGDLIPPETEIARSHRISRHTVRQAIVELAREGLLRRERGRGTYVAERPQPLVQSLGSFYSFAHEMQTRGFDYISQVIYRGVRGADQTAAARLRLDVGAPLIEMEILRLVDNAPVSLEFSLTPHELFPALLQADVSKCSLYDVMRDAHGVEVTLGREELRPVVLDRRQAALLAVPPGTPAFHVDRETMAGQAPIEWRRSLVRGDRYLFRAELPVR
ncbi:MAG: GntR family transcriptional regulator [Chloroflexi bacterium]|nr:GntR family transcriptional regulator [Chloroflexota bacterium]